MSSYTTFDKLNLSPLQSKYFTSKGDINVNPEIQVYNYSHCIPPEFGFTGDIDAVNFPNTLTGANPYSTQKFYSKRVLTENVNVKFRVIAKIPFVGGTNLEYIKPYRSGFISTIYFTYAKPPAIQGANIVRLAGAFPTTIDSNTDPPTQTTKQVLNIMVENQGDYEMQVFSQQFYPFNLLGFGVNFDAFFTIGTNTGANNDTSVPATNPNYIYIGTYFNPIGTGEIVIIKTLFEYI